MCVSLCLFVGAQSKVLSDEMKATEGSLGREKTKQSKNIVSPVAHTKEKHLSGRTPVLKNVYPRSSSDLSAFFPHAVITGPTLKYCLPDGKQFLSFST